MPAFNRKINAIFLVFFFFVFNFPCLAADVVINEILPNPSKDNPEWVELYNQGNKTIDLIGWYLQDKANHQKTLESLGQIEPGQIKVLNGNKDGWLLNNASETIYLKDSSDNIKDSYSYSSDPGEDKSIGREKDGADNWVIFDEPTKGSPNEKNFKSPSPLPSPSFLPSPSPSPSPEILTAVYKINEVKDEDNNNLSSVKIYVDNVYTHHYAPETFEFCQNCKCGNECDENIDFNFGQHTITLVKSGYEDWQETRMINSGENYEINPVMVWLNTESLPSPLPSPSSSPIFLSPSPSFFLSPSPLSEEKTDNQASFSGEVFGASVSSQQEDQTSQSAEQEEKNKKQKHLSLPLIISLTGIIFLGVSAIPWIKKIKWQLVIGKWWNKSK